MTAPDQPRRAVLFDAYPHTYGGAQRIDHLLARELPARGWSLHTITPGPGVFPDRLAADDLLATVVPVPASLGGYGRSTTGGALGRAALALPGYWLRLWRAFRRLRPDVVAVVDHRGMVLAGVPARLSGARVVWHIHALDRTRPLNRWGGRLSHVTLVPTRSVVPKLPGLDRARELRAVGNVVPAELRRPEVVPLAGRPVIVTMARLHPDKGLDVLIDALAEVRRSVPDAVVRVLGAAQAGAEDIVPDLLARAEQRGVGSAFELLGFVDRPDEVLATARCYVQPARERTEILPLAILEAMAVGVPVVATDVGGVGDIVQDGRTGTLVPPEDPRRLAEALVAMLRDEERAERCRHAAFTLVSAERFHIEGLVTRVLAAYEGRPDA
ncbi:MAG: glycosyltransferase family 4 protein [Acidimicrobiales bacterium]|nr:glycosyltransferase family 4 protein [Acidimicrobiales bacterium]